jgi:hypothetical protein
MTMIDALPIRKRDAWCSWALVSLGGAALAAWWATTSPARPSVTVSVLSLSTLIALGVTMLALVGVGRRPRIDDRRALLLLYAVVVVVRGYAALVVSLVLVGPHVGRVTSLLIASLLGVWLLIDTAILGVIIWLANFSAHGRVVTIRFHKLSRGIRAIGAAADRVVPRLLIPFRAVSRWAGFYAPVAGQAAPRLPIGRAAVFWIAWISVVIAPLAWLVSGYGGRGDAWIILYNGALFAFVIAASGYRGYLTKRLYLIRIFGVLYFGSLSGHSLNQVQRGVSAWPAAGLVTGAATVAFAVFVVSAWRQAGRAQSAPARPDTAT